MEYVEEREYTITVKLRARFPADYEGEADGYEWLEPFDSRIRPQLARTVIEILASEPGWRVTPVSRGLRAEDALELVVERKI